MDPASTLKRVRILRLNGGGYLVIPMKPTGAGRMLRTDWALRELLERLGFPSEKASDAIGELHNSESGGIVNSQCVGEEVGMIRPVTPPFLAEEEPVCDFLVKRKCCLLNGLGGAGEQAATVGQIFDLPAIAQRGERW